MSRNDITGDVIATKPASAAFRDGFDRIFGKPTPPTMICPECGIDRFKDGCTKWPCAMTATAGAPACACEPGRCWTTAQCCVDWTKRGAKWD